MKVRCALLVCGLVAVALFPGTSASAKPLEKGHFDDVFTSDVYDCDGDGPGELMYYDDVDIHVNYLFNQRGSSAFAYYQESVQGTVVTTNVDTGGTWTQVFASTSKDQTIVDNGDGTITITVFAAGGWRGYDQYGKLVLKDPGEVRFAFDVNFNGTPGDESDDTVVEDSFRNVRESTGLNDLKGRDFCELLEEFTT